MSLSRLACKGFRLSFNIPETCKLNHNYVKKATITSKSYPDDEYTDVPNYPPILDLKADKVYQRERDYKLDKIKKVGTVEEKIIGINMPRYYGWSSLMLKEGNLPFSFMPFVQHITRTDYIMANKFPFSNKLSQSELESVINVIRPQIQNAIILEMEKKRHRHDVDGTAELMGEGQLSDEVTKGVVEQINQVLIANLAQHAPHLYETEIDYEPRIEAFWRVGGFYPDDETYKNRVKDKEDHKKALKTNRFAKRKIAEEPDDLVGHFIQYEGQPVLQLRHADPLRPLEPQLLASAVPPGTEENPSPTFVYEPLLSHVPVYRYDPGFFALEKIRRRGTNIPGFWPGDPSEFGLLSYHSRGHLLGRPSSFGEEDHTHTINSQAILAGYAWMLAQANYQGFSTFQDLTYPLTTTTIVTDGRVFSFFASQLNTLLLHDEFIDVNPKVNVCYGIPSLELFKKIDGNEILGWDDRVLELLVQAYLNTPAPREGVDLKPYLDKQAPHVKDIDHLERRVFLHNLFRDLSANRPAHYPPPEIYDWEMIYKVKFETRPMDARRRFFEVGEDPFKRRLSERKAEYIPRKFRDPTKPRKSRKDQFYPDV